jgi:lipid-A-disaccharide synthase
MSRKLFIIAGEPSGDLHGANLVKELKRLDPELEIACWGGDKMEKQGAKVLKHIDDLAFMGFVEVVANLFTILKNFKLCKLQIESFKPDAVLLIDYPGFNLRMAEHIKKMDIPVHYYISPQIWAWKESRAKKIKAFVDKVFVILPFEKAFYAKHGIEAEYVGHPLLDEIEKVQDDRLEFCDRNNLDVNRAIISVLPGSRKQEISKILPLVNRLQKALPNYQIVVSKVAWLPQSMYDEALHSDIKLIEGNTYELIRMSEAAVVTSGTATLETAILGTPEVVIYKANALSVILARWLVKIKYISLVNLILDRMAVVELIQGKANHDRLLAELKLILIDGSRRSQVLKDYEDLMNKLGTGGASEIVAKALLKSL